MIITAKKKRKTTIIIVIIIIIISTVFRGLMVRQGHSHVLRADQPLLSLGWQSSRDGVSIEISVVA